MPKSRTPDSRARSPLIALVLLLAATWATTGCSTPTEPSTPEQAPTSSVTIRITVDETSSEALPTGPSALSLRPGAGGVSALGFSFADVTSIQVDVNDGSTGNPLFLNIDLAPTASGWAGVLPALPQNRLLTFVARARGVNVGGDAGTNESVLFNGSTTQILATAQETVGITLVPFNDGATIDLPRIKKISIPGEFALGQSGNITFFVEATANRALSYTLTPATSGGSFQPSSGSFTMPSASSAFVVRYAPPPALEAPTEYTHELKITNQEGHSVSTTFKTRVVPPEPGGPQGNTPTVRVVFNPVINGLSASRALGTSRVTWTADVADDKPLTTLTYAWSFTPTGTVSPAPTFTTQANPTVLQGYTPTLEGTLTLVVTDGDAGVTTVKYVLAAQQFPDQPTQVGGATDLAQIRAGDVHTCALLNDGSVRCWGSGGSGRLGYGNVDTVGDNETPFARGAVPLTEKVSQLATGGAHTCALLSNGLVRCWGLNQFGQLGYGHTNSIGDTEPVLSEVHVSLGTQAVRITAGTSHTCALLTTGRVRCWGRNNTGQLGYGHTNNIGDDEKPSASVDVQLGAPVQDVVAQGDQTCVLLFSGKVRCWGSNTYGQLGYSNGGSAVGDNEHPSSTGDVSLGGIASQLTVGSLHTCALMDTGAVRCWGYNGVGQVGNGSTGATFNPTVYDVSLGVGNKAIQVAAGTSHTCALLGSGLIKCWGANDYGQLGYGNITALTQPSGTSSGLNGIPAYFLTAGSNHTCALLTNGRALCWGMGNSGQLGYGNTNHIGDTELPSSQTGIAITSP
jgi:alpha-tubulin suppressor-like RCC1 family protein